MAKEVLETKFRDDHGNLELWYLPQLLPICREWVERYVACKDGAFVQLLLLHERRHDAAERIYRAIVRSFAGSQVLKPIPRPYDTLGSGEGGRGHGPVGAGGAGSVNRRRLLLRLTQGYLHNVAFGDMIDLLEGFGFRLDRRTGSHHLFVHPNVPEVLNFQPEGSQAKPYQIRQFLRLIEEYQLRLED